MRIVIALLPLTLALPSCAGHRERPVTVVAQQRECPPPAMPPEDLMQPPEVMDFLSN